MHGPMNIKKNMYFQWHFSCILHYISICLMDRFIVWYLLPCSTSAESDSNFPGNKETENVSRMIISVSES